MWIKKTSVKAKSGNYTYIQLIQSSRVAGKTRHKVVANLGRMDQLDMAQVETLVKSISSGTEDALAAEQLRLLPTRKYGPVMLLKRLMEATGAWRFLGDLVHHKKMNPDTVYAVFALLTYYVTNQNGDRPFFHWLEEYDLPGAETIHPGTLEDALVLLNDTLAIRFGLLKPRQGEAPCYHYIYRGINDNVKKNIGDGIVSLVVNGDFSPVSFQTLTYRSPYYYTLPFPSDLFVSDSFPLLSECKNFHPDSSRYICKLRREDMPQVFRRGGEVLDFVRSEGRFANYRGIGYRWAQFEGKTVVVLRPTPGYAGEVTTRRAEPREILAANSDGTGEQIVEHYLYLERVQNCFFNLFFPCDLDFLYEKLPKRAVLYGVTNLAFLKILCFHSLEERTSELGLTAEDIFLECDGILSTQLMDGTSARRFHSKLTPLQSSIFQKIGISEHPTIKFGPV